MQLTISRDNLFAGAYRSVYSAVKLAENDFWGLGIEANITSNRL